VSTAEKSEDEGASFDFGAVWRPIRKFWLTTVAITILVTVAVAYYTMRQTKIYEAEGEVQFDPNMPRPLGQKVESVVELGSGGVWDTKEYYETQYQIIQSRRVALEVVRIEGLAHDYCFLAMKRQNCSVPANFEDWDEDDAADALRGRLKVEPVKLSRIASVTLDDADPERAARLLKILMDRYRDLNVENVAESADQAQKSLRTENDKLRDELDKSEHDLHNYKEAKNLLSVEYTDQSNMLREEIGQLSSSLTKLKTQREEVNARYTQLAKVPSDNPAVLPTTELLASATLQGLRKEYVDAVRDRDGLIQGGKGKQHPDVLAADTKVDITKKALLDEVRNVQGSLKAELAAVDQQLAGVGGLYDKATKDALNLNLLEIDYSQLRRKKENTEKLYGMVLERAKENDISREFLMNNISIVDYPTVPKGPIKPNVMAFLGAGFGAGLFLGVIAAIARWQLDRTVKTPEDVDIALRTTFLGLIPEIDPATESGPPHMRRRGRVETGRELYVHQNPMSGIAEAARSVRTNLLFSTPDNPYRALLITSSGPNEGKTTVACCIATVMAQANKRVLLVDCDLRRSRLHRVFGFTSKTAGPGLTTSLLDGSDDCAVETEVPNLFLVSAGPTPPNPSELLQSERFRSFLARMKTKYDLVVLDSPPILPVTDATILSTQVDATVFVVRAFKTSKDLVQHGGRMLRDVGSKLAGVVLNAVNLERSEYKYSYKYYKRGDYYTTTGDRPSFESRDENHRAAPPGA